MRRRFIPRLSNVISFSVLILAVCIATNVVAQDSDPKIVSGLKFVLSADAIAAGIDGVFKAGLAIDATGTVKNVRLYGDPAWPCDTSPIRELKAVRAAVEVHLKQLKFSPWMKNGKARDADVMLDFAIGDSFKRAVAAEEAKKAPLPRIVKAGILNGRAISLMKPHGIGTKGIVTVQILIDEQGNVSKAGVLQGNRLLFPSSRDAACHSKFSPTLIEGKPVQVTGVINYIYH